MQKRPDELDPDDMTPDEARDEILIPKKVNRVQPNRRYKTSVEFDNAVVRYIKLCVKGGIPITKTGMVLGLGFSSHSTMLQYASHMGEDMTRSTERARLMVEFAYERRLHSKSPTGAMFALKQMGWKDSSEVNHMSPDGSMSPQPPSTVNIVGVPGDDNDEDPEA